MNIASKINQPCSTKPQIIKNIHQSFVTTQVLCYEPSGASATKEPGHTASKAYV
jgi:hypothetical protein